MRRAKAALSWRLVSQWQNSASVFKSWNHTCFRSLGVASLPHIINLVSRYSQEGPHHYGTHDVPLETCQCFACWKFMLLPGFTDVARCLNTWNANVSLMNEVQHMSCQTQGKAAIGSLFELIAPTVPESQITNVCWYQCKGHDSNRQQFCF